MNNDRHQSTLGTRVFVGAAAAFVCTWRIVAWQRPSALVSIEEAFAIPTALLGLLFLACGLVAWYVRPGRWTRIFLCYGVGGGVHWGGTIDAGSDAGDLQLLLVYLSFSGLADAALLHLALVFPRGKAVSGWLRSLLYAPALLALLLAPISGYATQAQLQGVAGLLLLAAKLMSLTAVVLFIVSCVRADAALRRATRLPLICASIIGATLFAMAGATQVLPGPSDLWNLAYGAVPVCCAIALMSVDRDAVHECAPTRTAE